MRELFSSFHRYIIIAFDARCKKSINGQMTIVEPVCAINSKGILGAGLINCNNGTSSMLVFTGIENPIGYDLNAVYRLMRLMALKPSILDKELPLLKELALDNVRYGHGYSSYSNTPESPSVHQIMVDLGRKPEEEPLEGRDVRAGEAIYCRIREESFPLAVHARAQLEKRGFIREAYKEKEAFFS